MPGAAVIPLCRTTPRVRRTPRRWSAISSRMHYPDGITEETPMAVSRITHSPVLPDDVPRTVGFYARFLGLASGPRPDLGFPGAWLYAGDTAVLHVVGGKSREQLRSGG